MINSLSLPTEWKVIMHYLEDTQVRNEIHTQLIHVDKLSNSSQTFIQETLQSLGGNSETIEKIKLSFNTIHLFEHDKHLFYEPGYLFNRYRMITLRSSLYDQFQPLDIQKARNYCRTKEGEALKSGLNSEIWGLSGTETLFGASEPAGDFSGSGSSGWKFLALAQLIADCYFFENRMFIKRITPYDSLMSEGKIFQIAQPLRLQNLQHKAPIINYIARQLQVDLPKS